MKLAVGEQIVREERFGDAICTLTNKRLIVSNKSGEDSNQLDRIQTVKASYGKGIMKMLFGGIFIVLSGSSALVHGGFFAWAGLLLGFYLAYAGWTGTTKLEVTPGKNYTAAGQVNAIADLVDEVNANIM